MSEEIIKVTEPVIIEDGKHKGKITKVVRSLPNAEEGRKYDYTELYVEVTDHDKKPEIRVGFPTSISELSSLGKLLKKAGLDFSGKDGVPMKDIKDHLIDKKITFLCKTESTDAGDFARILRDTIDFK